MNFPFFIARRIYSDHGDHRKVSRPAIRIATIGVTIGLAVMIVTVAVVLGFKHTIRDKVVGFGSHIQVESFISSQSATPYPVCIDDSLYKVLKSIPGVRHVGRYAVTQGILKTDSDFLGVAIKGIGEDYDTHFLQSNVVEGKMPAFSSEKSSYQIMISRMTANKLGLSVGDRVYAYFIGYDDVRARKFNVAAIYETNMTQFDEALCFTDLPIPVKLNKWEKGQCSGAELLVDNFDQLKSVSERVIERVNRHTDHNGEILTSHTIQEACPQIFSWLNLLDINVWIILALMVCVAGFTMISGLLIIILERTQTIGLLKALGARNKSVRHTFLWFAVFIVGQGLLWGNIIGIGVILLQQHTGFIQLNPANYYVSTAPMELNIPLIVLLNIATLLITIFILIAPSYLVSRIHPARSMRYE
ncbi:MAG: ABC transporter permease [Prevotella sp.]|nr:ABC transporter permease [Prevotella sp.]